MARAKETLQTVNFSGGRVAIGRNRENELVLDHPSVSRFHAEIVVVGGVIELRDLQSDSGTSLRGRSISRGVIRDGDRFGVGEIELQLAAPTVAGSDGRTPAKLDANELTVRADGKPILDRVSATIAPGELVGVIGESGSGKSTLLKLLAGVTTASSGAVTLGGRPIAASSREIGYVPQDEIVHPRLSVREALSYAARLRLPPEAAPGETEGTIERVLAELSLDEHATKRIQHLSGGQRKRTGVASELLNRPSLLLLDEPTTGLDPGLEAQTMRLFRELAHPEERAVVVVTHATGSLELCDRLMVMARGGKLAYLGPPQQALTFFGVDSYDEIYGALLAGDAESWRRKFEAGRTPPESTPEPPTDGQDEATERKRPSTLTQLGALTGRYTKLFTRDTRNLAILFGQVPLIALATALLFTTGLFDQSAVPGETSGDPRYAIQLLFILVTTAIWFGAITSAREIIKERAVAEREAAVGVRWGAYLASKFLLLATVVTIQVVLLTFMVLAIHPLDEPAGTYAGVIALLVLASFTAIALGLLVSAAVRTQEQATSLIPLTLIPQLLLAGAVVPIERMSDLIAALSYAVTARWALAGVGSAVDMNERISTDPILNQSGDFGTSFFALLPGPAAVILIGFTAGFSLITLFVLGSGRGSS